MSEQPPAAPARSRTAVVLAAIAGALVIVLAVAIPLVVRYAGDDEEPGTSTSSADSPSMDAVQVYSDQRADHVDEEVDYEQAPPVGGMHDAAWLDCGRYDRPVREENAVHSLEHGTVWIAHDPGLPEGDIDVLAEKLPDEGILAPHDELDAPVVVTVWGAQLELDGADDPRLDLFIDEYGDGHTSPEAMASCVGGVEQLENPGTNV